MLQDKRSWRFVEQFTSQWLELNRLDTVAVSPEIYPHFKEEIKEDMRDETQHFFAYILRHNMSALNLIDSDFSLMSDRLHRYYRGDKRLIGSREIKKVAMHKNLKRGGGILTHGVACLVMVLRSTVAATSRCRAEHTNRWV